MAEDLMPTSEPSQGRIAEQTTRPAHPLAGRFTTVKVVAIGLGAVILALGASALAMPTKKAAVKSSSEWASWIPTASGQTGLDQISTHVGRRYRNQDGQQLVAVSGGPLSVSGTPAKIAIRNADGKGNIQLVQGESVMFQLCGLGPRCSIATGTPSIERRLLIQREALELALYAMHSNESLDNVVVLAPPRPGKETVRLSDGTVSKQDTPAPALLLQRSRLQELLDKPLSDSLPDPVPTISGIKNAPETALVAELTLKPMFTASFIQTQDGSAYVVLDRLT
jgi:hypothetical protein